MIVNTESNIIAIIKAIRNTAAYDLAQAKALAKSAPVTIAGNRLEEQANPIISAFVAVGTEVELK